MFELEIIIHEIKALGHLLITQESKTEIIQPEQQQILDKRKLRLAFGDKLFISKEYGYFKSKEQLCFYQPLIFMYDHHSRVLNIEIFREHEFGKNDDYRFQLNAVVDLSDISEIKGDHIQTVLTDVYGSSLGKLLIIVDVFKKGPRFYEKVIPAVLFQKVKQEVERERMQYKINEANKNIHNLMVVNQITNINMAMNVMQVIPDIEDPQIYNKKCYMMIKYGPSIRAYTKIVKSQTKDSTLFNDQFQFLKNDDFKFEFYFFYIDQLGNHTCKASGEIKYIVFDENNISNNIVLFDKKFMRYGVLVVKFVQRQNQGNISYKTDKIIKENENIVNESLDAFNQYKFELKYSNQILIQKIKQTQLDKLREKEELDKKPMTEEEKKVSQLHKKFIEFLQKEMAKIEKEMQKKEEKNKEKQRKQKYLPQVYINQKRSASESRSMHNSSSFSQFREGKVKLPKV